METRILDNKIGVKALKKDQLEYALPDMNLLFSKLEDVRNRAENVSYKYEDYSLHNNLKYDNIYSIIGERGTGKTSVIFSIYNQLSGDGENDTGDIVVPMIIPEMMSEDDSLIGWIVTAIEQVIKKLETQIKQCRVDYNSDEDDSFFKKCVFNSKNKLRSQYEHTLHELLSVRTRGGELGYSHSESIRIEQDRIGNSYSIINELRKLWDVIISTKKRINESMDIFKNGKVKEPLIYIFIDDADLVPRILDELLYFMPKYMSHPNIAVIVSLSQSLMKISLEHNLYREITGQPLNMLNYPVRRTTIDEDDDIVYDTYRMDYNKAINTYRNISHLSNDILLKVFASSNRFYINEYNTLDKKANFILQRSNQEKEATITLEDFFCEFIGRLNKFTNADIDVDTDLKITRMISYIPAMYFSFLGCTAREIGNVCIAMEDMLEKFVELDKKAIKRNDEKVITKIYNIISELMNVIIDSNPNYRFLIKRKQYLFMNRYNNWSLYVNYAELNSMFGHKDYFETNKSDKLKIFISAYAMLNFIEHIIYIILPGRKKTHGYYEMFEMLFDMCECEHIIRRENNLYSVFVRLEHFYDKDIIQRFNINEMVHQDLFLNSVLLEKDRKDISNNKIRARYYYSRICNYVENDRAWGKLLCRILFKRFSGIWHFENISPDDCRLMYNVVDDDAIKRAGDSLRENLTDVIINRADYISWSQKTLENIDYFMYGDEEGLWDKTFNTLSDKCSSIAKDNGGIIRISEVQTELDKLINNNILQSWIKYRCVVFDIKDLYDDFKSRIYFYQNSDKAAHKVAVIKDTKKFIEIMNDLRGNSLQIDRMLDNVMEKNRECSKGFNQWIDQTIKQQKEALAGVVNTKQKHPTIRKNKALEAMRNSLIEPDEITRLYNDLRRIWESISRTHYVRPGFHHIYELVELCEMAFYYDDKSFYATVDYLMSIRAIVHIYDKYIATLLMENNGDDNINNSVSYTHSLDEVYSYIASEWSHPNNFMQVFKSVATEEQQKVIDRLLNG